MHRFFRLCHSLEGRVQLNTKTQDSNLEANLHKNIKDLEKAQLEPLVRFLHLVLDKLFTLLVRPTAVSGTVGEYKDIIINTFQDNNTEAIDIEFWVKCYYDIDDF